MAIYNFLASFAQQAGTVYFVLIFLAVLAYVFWPSNRETFKKASRAALDAEE